MLTTYRLCSRWHALGPCCAPVVTLHACTNGRIAAVLYGHLRGCFIQCPLRASLHPVPSRVPSIEKRAHPAALLQYEVMAMLWQVAATYGWKVRPLTITNAAPFASHVTAMSETGILMARHGPSIADAVFLPAGAAVYELLPYNWEWRQISELYRNITRSGGELHHYAWRANAAKWANYPTLDDERYSTWTAAECVSRCACCSSCGLGQHWSARPVVMPSAL